MHLSWRSGNQVWPSL